MDNVTLVIDGHVHLYPDYDLITAVEHGTKNLLLQAEKCAKENSDIIPMWLLVERFDSNFFDQIYRAPEDFSQDDIKFKKGSDKLTIVAEKNNHIILYIFVGRQLVTREGLEVLSLITDLNIPDRKKTIDEVIQNVQDSGGIPALNWAPGKWFFSRGKVIAKQIAGKSPDEFFIGETTLRHTLWPQPRLIRQARKNCFSIIAGSDPLPFKGEETGIGSYGFLIKGKFDPENPAQSLRNLIISNRKDVKIIGKRNNVVTFAKRQSKIMMEKRSRD